MSGTLDVPINVSKYLAALQQIVIYRITPEKTNLSAQQSLLAVLAAMFSFNRKILGCFSTFNHVHLQ